MQDKRLMQQLQQAFAKNVKGGIIDLDQLLIDRNSFSILRLEDLYAKTKGPFPPFRQTDALIIFVKRGEGKRTIGHYTFNIEDNTLAVVPKRVIHASNYTRSPEGYFITFSPDFFLQQAFPYQLLNSKRVLNASMQAFIVLTQEQSGQITAIFDQIIEECDSGFEEKSQMIALKLLELLLLCDRFLSEGTPRPGTVDTSNIVHMFNELIEGQFMQHHDVHFYAGILHTHPNNLNHIVKKATGLTAKQTVTKRLMNEAKSLLTTTNLSVKEIAYQLGFEDPNYFVAFFKKGQKSTPTKFRSESQRHPAP
jgi:AraC family transcriptional regulator, transcriptional activator of pobA